MTPRTIAEPIFPAPTIPILSFDITYLPCPGLHSSQNKALERELQSIRPPKAKRPSACRRRPQRILTKDCRRFNISFPTLEVRVRLGHRRDLMPKSRGIFAPPPALCQVSRKLRPESGANRFACVSYAALLYRHRRLCPTSASLHKRFPAPHRVLPMFQLL